MKKSIYHLGKFGVRPAIRLNLRAIRELMPEHKITDFNLSENQRRELQRRLDLYVTFGGKCDFNAGTEDRPEKLIPERIMKARPERTVRGSLRRATREQVIPARIRPATVGIEPSIDHLPNKEALARVIRVVTR